MKNQSLKFNLNFLREFWQLLKPYWTSEEKYSAYGLLFLNIGCIIAEVRANVAINDFSKNFYDSLQTFNNTLLVHSLWQFVVILIALIIAVGYSTYFNGLLCIRWRRWLTRNYLQKWLSNRNYYRLHCNENSIDNPDQRICEDLEKFATATLKSFFTIFQATLTLVTFGIILWNLSGDFVIPIGAIQFHIPGYLFWCAIFYAVIGTLMIQMVGKKLAFLDYLQQRYNADFRYNLIRFRDASEQIALYGGEKVENEIFDHSFKNVFSNFLYIIRINKNLTFFKNGYNTASFVFGLTVAIPLYLQKKIQLGGMMQISGAFATVIDAISLFVNQYTFFAEWRAVIHRLTEFNKDIQQANNIQSRVKIKKFHQNDIVINQLNIQLPNGKMLLENLNYVFQAGKKYLISGASGSGKSTFMRTLAGMWPHGQGEILIPHHAKMLFLPQKPYFPQGTLFEVLCYPNGEKFSDSDMETVLENCQLAHLKTQLHQTRNWLHELSLGEQQLIAFSRIFLSEPDIVFLDEATSALDEKTEVDVFRKLFSLFPEMSVICISHRKEISDFDYSESIRDLEEKTRAGTGTHTGTIEAVALEIN